MTTIKQGSGKIIDMTRPKYYFNRELSLIEFNKRVLMEAQDKSHPLLERLKFICIFSSNMDEFFMIRVAGLKSQVQAGILELSFDGMSPGDQLSEIRKRLIPLFKLQEKILNDEIIPELHSEGIFFQEFSTLTSEEKSTLESYFIDNIMPVLTPLCLDSAHPFPRLVNRSLNIAFRLDSELSHADEPVVAFLQVPQILQRFVLLNREDGVHYVLLEQIIKAFADKLFPGHSILAANVFRVTRDADIEIAEDEAEDLLKEIAEQIKHRKWGRAAVRLEVHTKMSKDMLEFLRDALGLHQNDVYVYSRPLNLQDFMQLLKIEKRHLKDKPFHTRIPDNFKEDGELIFEAIKKKDTLVHHPFMSFSNSVLRFLDEAADDKDTLAIKITLYRTGLNSPIVSALKRAAENGKEVTAFVELKARFDEENNIIWAKELEQVGVHVVYGILGLKTHCKIAMVVRRENGILKKYMHLATGNYNSSTSKLYTDVGLFTADPDFGTDGINLFNYLTGYSNNSRWNKFIVAPISLRRQLIEFINREAELHSPDNPGLIIAKMNALAHDEVIQSLYRASRKGVQIKLLVRGICCLKPGIPEVSDNIQVRSIIGRFLEHSRIFYFRNSGNDDYYLSSADWMTRNLHKRVELMFPVQSLELKKYLANILEIYWRDNSKSWQLQSDGSYRKISPSESEKEFSAQEYLIEKNKSNKKSSRHALLRSI